MALSADDAVADDPAVPALDPADAELLADVAAALRDERRRAPGDLLGILALILVVAAVATFAVGVVAGSGVPQDVLLNLASELVGVVLTVVLIGGLWHRVQTSSYETMDDLVTLVEAHRTTGLDESERAAYRAMVDLHRRTARSGFLVRLATGFLFAIRNRRRLAALEGMLRRTSA
jgi:hypothetical protein